MEMKFALFTFVLILGCANLVEGIKCQVCTSESCRGQRGYVTEECPLGVKFCYSLASDRGIVYRAGCAFSDCSRIQVSGRSTCAVCDRDNCNGIRSLKDSNEILSMESSEEKNENSSDAESKEFVNRAEGKFGLFHVLPMFLISFAYRLI